MTIKKDLKIYSVNRLYLIFKSVNGYITEINGNQYLKLVPIIESQKKQIKIKIKKIKIKKYEELWSKITNLIKLIPKTTI